MFNAVRGTAAPQYSIALCRFISSPETHSALQVHFIICYRQDRCHSQKILILSSALAPFCSHCQHLRWNTTEDCLLRVEIIIKGVVCECRLTISGAKQSHKPTKLLFAYFIKAETYLFGLYVSANFTNNSFPLVPFNLCEIIALCFVFTLYAFCACGKMSRKQRFAFNFKIQFSYWFIHSVNNLLQPKMRAHYYLPKTIVFNRSCAF